MKKFKVKVFQILCEEFEVEEECLQDVLENVENEICYHNIEIKTKIAQDIQVREIQE